MVSLCGLCYLDRDIVLSLRVEPHTAAAAPVNRRAALVHVDVQSARGESPRRPGPWRAGCLCLAGPDVDLDRVTLIEACTFSYYILRGSELSPGAWFPRWCTALP